MYRYERAIKTYRKGLKVATDISKLTVESIRNDGLPLAGWVANQADQTPMDLMTENLSALQQRIAAPCLGVLAWQQQLMPASLSAYLALPDQSPMKSEPF